MDRFLMTDDDARKSWNALCVRKRLNPVHFPMFRLGFEMGARALHDALLLRLKVAHHCHAVGCKVKVKPELLCCGPHWRLVPPIVQGKVYGYYRRGQCDDKRPSFLWCFWADVAIAWIAKREGKPETKKTFVRAFHRGAPPPSRSVLLQACFPT